MKKELNDGQTILRAVFGEHEFLEIRSDGMVTTHSLLRSGHRFIQVQMWPGLMPWLTKNTGGRLSDLAITVQKIADPTDKRLQIPTAFAIFLKDSIEFPILITREPLPPKKFERVLRALPPISAALNNGVVHISEEVGDFADGL